MKLKHYERADSLYICLASGASSDAKESADGPVVDFDEAGLVVGLVVQHASERIDLSSIESQHLPIANRIA